MFILASYIGLTYLIGSANQEPDTYQQGINGLTTQPVITTAFVLVSPFLMARSRSIFVVVVACIVTFIIPHPPIGYLVAGVIPAILLSPLVVFIGLLGARRLYESIRINLAQFDNVHIQVPVIILYGVLCATMLGLFIELRW